MTFHLYSPKKLFLCITPYPSPDLRNRDKMRRSRFQSARLSPWKEGSIRTKSHVDLGHNPCQELLSFPQGPATTHRTLMTMHMSCPNCLVTVCHLTSTKTPQNAPPTSALPRAPSPSDSHHLIQPSLGMSSGVITSLDQ